MKHGKKPTVAQRKHLQGYRLNPGNWLIVKDTAEGMEIIHRETGRMRKLPGRAR